MVQFISRTTLNMLEEKMRNRDEYEKEIRIKILELEDKFNAENIDENVGGGSSNRISKPQETYLLNIEKYEKQEYIRERIKWKKAINDTLNELDEESREIIDKKLWGEYSYLTWGEVAKKYYVSQPSISRLRKKVLISFGKKIGEF